MNNTIQDGERYNFGKRSLVAKIIKNMLFVLIVAVVVIFVIASRNHEMIVQVNELVGVDLSKWIAIVGIVAIFMVAIIQIFIAWIEYVTTTFQITENAFIVKKGFFLKHENSFPIRYINNVSYTQGIFDQALGVGTCIVDMVSDEQDATYADKVILSDMDQGLVEELENILLNRAQAQKVVVASN